MASVVSSYLMNESTVLSRNPQTRAALVSVNLFSLLCDGTTTDLTLAGAGNIMRFGGPIAYLIVSCFVFVAILLWVDSGSILPRRLGGKSRISANSGPDGAFKQDVISEAQTASDDTASLRILNVTKSFGNSMVVDDVSLGVHRDTVFALLGPNGAGEGHSFFSQPR